MIATTATLALMRGRSRTVVGRLALQAARAKSVACSLRATRAGLLGEAESSRRIVRV